MIKTLEKTLKQLVKLAEEIRALDSSIDVDVDFADPEQKQLYMEIGALMYQLDKAAARIEYLDMPCKEYILHKNEYGRYVTENGLTFSEGRMIEYLNDGQENNESAYWHISTVAYNGTDYCISDTGIALEGLKIRVRHKAERNEQDSDNTANETMKMADRKIVENLVNTNAIINDIIGCIESRLTTLEKYVYYGSDSKGADEYERS